MLPEFTASITVDGVPLGSTGLDLSDLGLGELNFESTASNLSPVGFYLIKPVAFTGDGGSPQEGYKYEFVNESTMINIYCSPVDVTFKGPAMSMCKV